jgi:ABC-type sugar transport system permease subunit
MREGELSKGRLALLLNAPALAGLLLILAYPIAFAGYLSLHTVSLRQLRSG